MGGLMLGLFGIALGLAFVLAGLRMFLAILPLGVFLVGWYVSGLAFSHLGEDGGFLDTPLSFMTGLVFGTVLAVVSYLLWYVGTLILIAATGATIASGILAIFSADAGVLQFVLALVGATIALYIAYEFYVPTWIVIVGTSLFGAIILVVGVMLVLDRVDIDELQNGPALAAVNHSWLWVLAWAGLAAGGTWSQYLTARHTELPEKRWTLLQPQTFARVGRRSKGRRE